MLSPELAAERKMGETTDHATASAAATPRRGAGPFLYTSGARPLEGYTLKRGVDQGGFGEIYYATSDAGKEVALKLIRRNLDVELRGMRQCLNLKHPNLLSLYDIRQDNQGDTWVVMEYMSGRCLEDVLAERPKGLPLDETLVWIHGIGAGVAYLHDRGIVHRDLKPGNIFCDEGVVKVGDYGLSKFISCSRRSGHTESIGTVHYMAPEVANGRYGKELDIYALGIILYEMLTGQVPFDGESVGEVLMKHLTAQPDVSMLEEPYRGIIARTLDKDPERRFSTVPAMLAGLPPAPAAAGVSWARVASPAGSAAGGEAKPQAAPNTAQPQPAQPEIITAQLVHQPSNEEPLWRFIRENWRKLRIAWARAEVPGFVRAIVFLMLIFTVISAMHVALPLAFVLVPAYMVYYCGRKVYLAWPSDRESLRYSAAVPRARPVSPPPRAQRVAPPPPSANPARETVTVAMVCKPVRERVADLLGSMLGSALVVTVMCVVATLVEPMVNPISPGRPETFAWLGLVSLAATWAMMLPGKFWEGTRGDPMLRRFVLMIFGLGVGAFAYMASEAFMVSLPHNRRLLPVANFALTNLYTNGRPELGAYMVVFATLFAAVRWWRQTNPLRPSRLRLGAIIASGAMAGLVAYLWRFPQPWLIVVAVIVSVAVQVSSPWVPQRDRLRPQRKTMV